MRTAILVPDIWRANTPRAVLDRKNHHRSALAYRARCRRDGHLRVLPALQTGAGGTVSQSHRATWQTGRRLVRVRHAILVPHSFNFPLYCFHGASCNKKWNLILFDTYGQRHWSAFFVARLCASISGTQATTSLWEVKSQKVELGCVPITPFCFFGDPFNWSHHQ